MQENFFFFRFNVRRSRPADFDVVGYRRRGGSR